MKLLTGVKDKLVHKYGTKSNVLETIQNAPAVESSEVHKYVKNIQEVVVSEQHDVELRHVIQPITEDVLKPTQSHERHRPAVYRESVQQYSQEDLNRSEVNENALTAMGEHTVEEDIVEEVAMEPVVTQRHVKHVIEVVQPVVKRRVVVPHVVNETVPIFEKHVRYNRVNEIHTLPAITYSEWVERQGVQSGSTNLEKA